MRAPVNRFPIQHTLATVPRVPSVCVVWFTQKQGSRTQLQLSARNWIYTQVCRAYQPTNNTPTRTGQSPGGQTCYCITDVDSCASLQGSLISASSWLPGKLPASSYRPNPAHTLSLVPKGPQCGWIQSVNTCNEGTVPTCIMFVLSALLLPGITRLQYFMHWALPKYGQEQEKLGKPSSKKE